MNLINPFRDQLAVVPALNDAFDLILAKINTLWNVEHDGEGHHTDITADSLTVDDDVTIGGTVTATGGVAERGRTTRLGEWTDVAYDAANFTASGGANWTVDSGDQIVYAYTLIGLTMTLAFQIDTTDLDAGASVRIALPTGFTCARTTTGLIQKREAAVFATGLCLAGVGKNYLECFADVAGANFGVTAADDLYVRGCLTFSVQ